MTKRCLTLSMRTVSRPGAARMLYAAIDAGTDASDPVGALVDTVSTAVYDTNN
jgi:hypothetical protein